MLVLLLFLLVLLLTRGKEGIVTPLNPTAVASRPIELRPIVEAVGTDHDEDDDRQGQGDADAPPGKGRVARIHGGFVQGRVGIHPPVQVSMAMTVAADGGRRPPPVGRVEGRGNLHWLHDKLFIGRVGRER